MILVASGGRKIWDNRWLAAIRTVDKSQGQTNEAPLTGGKLPCVFFGC